MRGDSGLSERSGEIYLPFVGHIADDAVLLRDGSICAMGQVAGVPLSWKRRHSGMRGCEF